MNERIQELKDEAWATCEEPEQYMDKFAELLIKECASAVNSRDDSDTGFWANIIKQHFGVKNEHS